MPSRASQATRLTGNNLRRSIWTFAALLAPLSLSARELPLIVEAPEEPGQSVAIFLSGDGGWAAIDAGISSVLRGAGYGVVGIDARRYFAERKAPSELGRDLADIANTYLPLWHRDKLLLIGYSRGADTIPFAAQEWTSELQARIEIVVLLAPATYAGFEFHLADLWSSQRRDGDLDTFPAVQALASHVVCIYGANEEDSLCPLLQGRARRTVIQLPGGHHFDGDYAALGQRVLDAVATIR